MKSINRSVAIVRPKKPYIDWASSLDELSPESATNLNEHVGVYLLPEYNYDYEVEDLLREAAELIFEEELSGWHTDPSDRPEDLSYQNLHAWFDVTVESVIVDLANGPVIGE